MYNPVRQLEARVRAVNKANKYAMELSKVFAERFAPLVGCKILTVNGDILNKYVNLVAFLAEEDRTFYRYRSNLTLAFTVKARESVDENTFVYHETTITVGELEGGVLKAISPPFIGITSYTYSEIRLRRENYKVAQKLADTLKNDLYPFGETDR